MTKPKTGQQLVLKYIILLCNPIRLYCKFIYMVDRRCLNPFSLTKVDKKNSINDDIVPFFKCFQLENRMNTNIYNME